MLHHHTRKQYEQTNNYPYVSGSLPSLFIIALLGETYITMNLAMTKLMNIMRNERK
jgi:hypothetical protein